MPSFSKTTTGEEVVRAFAKQVAGKTIVITGPSKGGIGAEAAYCFAAANPKEIILAGRTEAKVSPVIQKIQEIDPKVKATFVKLDLADQSSVRKAAAEIISSVDKVDVLVNCAGIMAVNPYQTTADGIESQFGANHIGHFLLTNLLMDKILAAGEDARVVNVTSLGYETCGVRYEDWNFNEGKDYNPWYGYGQSKSANVLFSESLGEKLKKSGGQAYSVHPGLILESNLQGNTAISQELFMEGIALATEANGGKPLVMETPKTLQQGCATILVAALDPSIADTSGALLSDCNVHPTPVKEHAKGVENTQKLWKLSEELVGQKFEI
ncbi:hypothetical protein MMC24_002444 [Lignoscripta atroalba]|nr:hypothetical protein [Lignoscripta atroalba]